MFYEFLKVNDVIWNDMEQNKHDRLIPVVPTQSYGRYAYTRCSTLKRGTLWLWAFSDIYENIQKIIKKTIRIFDPFSIVTFECLDQFL